MTQRLNYQGFAHYLIEVRRGKGKGKGIPLITSFITSNYLYEVRVRGLSIKGLGVALPFLPQNKVYPCLYFLKEVKIWA
ncbi:MAG: hypothetical protein AB1393_08975 [Candidatus Edwardsbacteria bacterium]